MPVLTPKTGVSKNKCVEGVVSVNTAPSFLRGYAVDKFRKAFHFQIAFVLSVRADGNGMPCDFLQQLFTVRAGRLQSMTAILKLTL